jgi:hypothetical protein
MESNKITENKKRKPNWTEDEKAILLEEYGKRKNTLKSRYNPSITHLHKTKAWQEITDKINSRNLAVKRTVEEVMKKYENVVVSSRKEINNYAKESGKTGELQVTFQLIRDWIYCVKKSSVPGVIQFNKFCCIKEEGHRHRTCPRQRNWYKTY